MSGTEWQPIVYGLASAALWGTGDFCGGLASKRAHVFSVIISSQIVGMILLIGLALVLDERMPSFDYLMLGGVAGLAGAAGLIALYRALATGRMGVAAPVAGVVGAAFPVGVGAAIEGLPGTLQIAGFGLAFVAVWLISRTPDAAWRLRDVGLPLAAGLGFGVFFVVIDRASDAVVLWPLVAARIASIVSIFLVASLSRQPRLTARTHLPLIALVGVLEVGGNAFYALAGQAGRLDVSAVVSSLYPAATVWLAWLILKERFTRLQTAGIAAALAAIVLIAL
jgi:drug/metabolite transporter (DMT)-like permease